MTAYRDALDEIATLRQELDEAKALVRTVDLYGTGYLWRSGGRDLMLDPTEVTVVRPSAMHPEGEAHCHRCGGPNVPWSAPSPLWNEVMRGGSINGNELYDGIVCLTCFAHIAEIRHIADLWKLSAKRVSVQLETVTPSGRVWDETTWMWRDA